MRLEDEQYEEIKRTVIDTFSMYGIRCIPISAFEMAVKMGLKVVPYSALNEEQREAAMSQSKDGFSIGDLRSQEWKIYYNDSCKCYGRINQTIMHEIGQYAMGHIKGEEEEEAEEALVFRIGQDEQGEILVPLEDDKEYEIVVDVYNTLMEEEGLNFDEE